MAICCKGAFRGNHVLFCNPQFLCRDYLPWPDEEAFSVTFIPADCGAKYYSKIMIRPAWLGEDK
jgi:hypothetical protein